MNNPFISILESPKIQLLFTIVITGLLFCASRWCPAIEFKIKEFASNTTFTAALASVFGSLLGFVIAATAIMMTGLQSSFFKLFKKSKQFQNLWNIFFSAVRVLGLGTGFAFVSILFSQSSWTFVIGLLLFACCTWVTLNLISCVLLLESVTQAVSEDDFT